MGDFLKRTVPILFITVAAYGLWRRFFVDKRINSCKVVDTSKEQCSTSINKDLFSPTGEDRLSELPNDIWPYLLSLLTFREVSRLAILSRYMRSVCLLLPSLDLDCRVMFGLPHDYLHSEECEQYKAAYVKIVNQILQNYKDQNIISLRLACCLDNNYSDDVDRWINITAANKHLQSLCLRFQCTIFPLWSLESRYKLLKKISCSHFSQFTSLRELHLQCCILKVETDLRLSNLTILDLTDVILEGIKWQGFLASSSTIKCLYLRMCNLPNKLCIGDNFPQLSLLNIGLCDNLQELELSARNLTTFEFQSFDDVKCSFLNVPLLENAGSYMTTPGYRNFFLNLATKASSLKHVFLQCADYLSVLLPSPESKFLMPALSLHMIVQARYKMDVLPHLLKFFPLLRRLELELPRKCTGGKYEFSYIHENLKEVRLFGFQVEWIPFAIFFLQNARVLDRLVLIVDRDTSGRRWGYESQCFSEDLLMGCQGCKVFSLSKKDCDYIRKALNGKAISATAEVIIENLQPM